MMDALGENVLVLFKDLLYIIGHIIKTADMAHQRKHTSRLFLRMVMEGYARILDYQVREAAGNAESFHRRGIVP